jgi:outer membrane protein OmpA-like peptidoglycan-associated protein
VQSQNSHM